jgi:hypothetical protein
MAGLPAYCREENNWLRKRWLAIWRAIGHASLMPPLGDDRSVIPSAPCDDLDLDRPEDEEEWERRVMRLADQRIVAERARLERLGVIDRDGNLVSTELTPDMRPESDTSVETG